MKKILSLTFLLACSPLYSVSIAEYVQKTGPILVIDGVINLSNQGITSLTGIKLIQNPDEVTAIDLSDNQIKSFTSSQINRFSNLERLNLSNNLLEDIPSLTLPKLKKLKVKYNKLVSLSNLNLPSLKKLKAGNNPITHLSNLYMPQLKKLKIKNAPIKSVENVTIDKAKKIKVGPEGKLAFEQAGIQVKKIK